MKLIKRSSSFWVGLAIAGGLTLLLMQGQAAGANVAANVTASGNNVCDGPANFSPTEVVVHPGDNVTINFGVSENEGWSISTNHYSQWGTVLVGSGQTRSVSFVAPQTSFSFQGSWSRNGCYRASGVVRVVPVPVAGSQTPLLPASTSPEPAEPRNTFAATPSPQYPVSNTAVVGENTAQAAGKNSPANLDINNLPGDKSTDATSPVTLLDGLVVAGVLTFSGICVAGLFSLEKAIKLICR